MTITTTTATTTTTILTILNITFHWQWWLLCQSGVGSQRNFFSDSLWLSLAHYGSLSDSFRRSQGPCLAHQIVAALPKFILPCPINTNHSFLCTMHSLQSKCTWEPFAPRGWTQSSQVHLFCKECIVHRKLWFVCTGNIKSYCLDLPNNWNLVIGWTWVWIWYGSEK